MAIVKWDPFRELTDIHRTMDRFFGDRYLRRPDEWLYNGWSPSVDVYETEKEIVVEAEIPGATEKDISVEVKDNLLTLSGERKKETEVKEENFHRVERSFGKFQRSFTLPDTVETEKVSAKMKNGVLKVRLPKAPKAVAQKVAVKAE
ncbi:MAG: Hsp20/alpha crystallin family protein [Nitrospinota bacterium]